MRKTLTCVNCPVGCRLEVELNGEGGIASVAGNECPRGIGYAAAEIARPERILTTTLRIRGAAVGALPVKTAAPVPKARLLEIAASLKDVEVRAPVRSGDVVVADAGGSGVDLIATRSLEACRSQ